MWTTASSAAVRWATEVRAVRHDHGRTPSLLLVGHSAARLAQLMMSACGSGPPVFVAAACNECGWDITTDRDFSVIASACAEGLIDMVVGLSAVNQRISSGPEATRSISGGEKTPRPGGV